MVEKVDRKGRIALFRATTMMRKSLLNEEKGKSVALCSEENIELRIFLLQKHDFSSH